MIVQELFCLASLESIQSKMGAPVTLKSPHKLFWLCTVYDAFLGGTWSHHLTCRKTPSLQWVAEHHCDTQQLIATIISYIANAVYVVAHTVCSWDKRPPPDTTFIR